MLLDQVVLEQQRLGLGVGHRDFDFRDLLDHRRGLRRVVAFLEIGRDALLQVTCLADVDDLMFLVEHAIDAGLVRQRLQEGLQVETLAH